jgi:hypothetical protein
LIAFIGATPAPLGERCSGRGQQASSRIDISHCHFPARWTLQRHTRFAIDGGICIFHSHAQTALPIFRRKGYTTFHVSAQSSAIYWIE